MSDGGGEESAGTMEVSAAVQTVADTSVLQKHIRKLVPLLLEDGGEAPATLESALEEKSVVEQMRKFLSDPQVHTILVERSSLKGRNNCTAIALMRSSIQMAEIFYPVTV
ncbi:cytoplasmic dynein 1 heavy chain 1-like [Arapaima gigas]